RYAWTFDGKTTASGKGPEVTRTFSTPGTHTVRLTVRDPAGATAHVDQTLLVGDTPPEVSIRLDGNHSFFWDTTAVAYRVSVSDAEDGSLGTGIAPSSVRVTLDYLPNGLSRTSALGHQADAPGLALVRQSDCLACH